MLDNGDDEAGVPLQEALREQNVSLQKLLRGQDALDVRLDRIEKLYRRLVNADELQHQRGTYDALQHQGDADEEPPRRQCCTIC